MSEATDTELVLVGSTGRAHGIDGEIRLFTEDPHADVFEIGATLYLESRDGVDAYEIERWRVTDDFVILGLAAVDDRTAAERLTNRDVFVEAAALPDLDDEEFYEYELEGREVVALESEGDGRERVGTVAGFFDTGANDVLVVERDDADELFVPMIEAAIETMEDGAGRLVLRPLDEWAPEDDES